MEYQQELIINISPDQFKQVISNNLKSPGSLEANKGFFGGTIDESSFALYRTKKYEMFDYNITLFRGVISNDSNGTKIKATFSLIGIYKFIVPLLALVFVVLDIFFFNSDGVDLPIMGLIMTTQGMVVASLWIQYRYRFRKDKEKYLDLLKSLFGRVDVNTG